MQDADQWMGILIWIVVLLEEALMVQPLGLSYFLMVVMKEMDHTGQQEADVVTSLLPLSEEGQRGGQPPLPPHQIPPS